MAEEDYMADRIRRDGSGWELTAPRAEARLPALRETVTVLDASGRIVYSNRPRD